MIMTRKTRMYTLHTHAHARPLAQQSGVQLSKMKEEQEERMGKALNQ